MQVLSPTLIDKSRYAQSTLSEVLNWLHIQNLDILESLERNKRILIEGGAGTGKTTMAKAFIKKHKGLKGLYLCQNILLYAKIREELVQADLYNCDVYTLNRYLGIISQNVDSMYVWTPKQVKDIMQKTNHKLYDYVIIDEAQDIADKGIDILIDNLTSISGDGLSTGNYLIFYDLEQGYNSNSRHIDNFVSSYLPFSAHYKLNENKRVITNRKIVSLANKLLLQETKDAYTDFIKGLGEESIPYLRTTFVNCNKDLFRAFKSAVKQSDDIERTVVLVHSAFKRVMYQGDSIYDLLSDKPGVHMLDEDNVVNPDKSSIPFTSILKYKGLETNKVILVIPASCASVDLNNFLFEIYVGFTRAMMELQIIIYSER